MGQVRSFRRNKKLRNWVAEEQRNQQFMRMSGNIHGAAALSLRKGFSAK
jgi:hypothetical protein